MHDQERSYIVELLEANNRLLQENNSLLRKQQNARRLKLVFRLLWSVLLLAIPFALYYFYIAPTLAPLQDFAERTTSLPSSIEIPEALENLFRQNSPE